MCPWLSGDIHCTAGNRCLPGVCCKVAVGVGRHFSAIPRVVRLTVIHKKAGPVISLCTRGQLEETKDTMLQFVPPQGFKCEAIQHQILLSWLSRNCT